MSSTTDNTNERTPLASSSSASSSSWSSWLWHNKKNTPPAPAAAATTATTATPAIPWLAPRAAAASDPARPTTTTPTTLASPPATAAPIITLPTPSSSTPLPTANPSTLSTPSPPPAVSPSSSSSPYNKYILATASLTAFSALLYTIRQRTRGKMAIPLQDLLATPQGRAANPKLAAYMFAGRAFGTATVLVLTGTLGASMAVASVLGVNNLKEFSTLMQEFTAARFPALKRSTEADAADSKFDKDVYEFLKEVSADAEREEREGEWAETPAHQIIGQRVRHEIGPFSRHGQN